MAPSYRALWRQDRSLDFLHAARRLANQTWACPMVSLKCPWDQDEKFLNGLIRFINVIDLLKLQPATEHPHGLSDRDFDSLFTVDTPIIFNFHGYPWLIHRLAYRRTNHANMHVRGYKEKGNINTPLELAINNQVDRFSIAMDVIDRVPKLKVVGAHAKEKFRNEQIDCCHYAYEHGIDKPEIVNWKWPS